MPEFLDAPDTHVPMLDFGELEDWFDQKILPLFAGREIPQSVPFRKVAEEMGEWLQDPCPEEAIDVIASLWIWAHLEGIPNLQVVLDAKIEKLDKRGWEILPDGRWHHVRTKD